jgi:hypothetical protein
MQWQPLAVSPFDEVARLLLSQYGPGGDWDASDAQNALGIASMFLELMGQYLEGTAALVRSRHVIVPLPPLVRSLFEAACQVAWILEPPPPRPGELPTKMSGVSRRA